MFFAQTLRKKLESEYKESLYKNQDCLFPYKITKNNNTTLLSELKKNQPKYIHIQLKKMTQKDFLRNFSKKNLLKKWDRKCKVNYTFTTKKIIQKIDKEKLEAKKYIKNLVDKDIFKLKTPRWNNSTKPNDNNDNINFKEHLRQIKYESEHCVKNKISKNKLNKIYDDDILIIHDDLNNGWNVSSKLEPKEKELIDKELYIKSMNNTQKFWLKKNKKKGIYNRLIIGNKNKKNLNKCNSDFMQTKTKDIMNPIIEEKKMKLFEDSKDNSNIFDNYISKEKSIKNYDDNEFCFKKKNMNLSDIINYKKTKNRWEDRELIEKIKLIEDWSDINIYPDLNDSLKQDNLKKEMLKKLIYNKGRIKEEQLKIKEEKKYNNLIRNTKNFQNNKPISPLRISKYPISKKHKSFIENTNEILNDNSEINHEENKSFIEAYKKIILEQNNKNKNKLKKRCLSSKNIHENKEKIIYFHPGIFRQFTYITNSINNNNEDNNRINEEKYMAWSCCNNIDKNSKGCEKKLIKFEIDNAFSIL